MNYIQATKQGSYKRRKKEFELVVRMGYRSKRPRSKTSSCHNVPGQGENVPQSKRPQVKTSPPVGQSKRPRSKASSCHNVPGQGENVPAFRTVMLWVVVSGLILIKNLNLNLAYSTFRLCYINMCIDVYIRKHIDRTKQTILQLSEV